MLVKNIFAAYSAFVKGRQILDNTAIAHEIIIKLKIKKGVLGCVAIKLDMSKAFDKVEWSFILDTL